MKKGFENGEKKYSEEIYKKAIDKAQDQVSCVYSVITYPAVLAVKHSPKSVIFPLFCQCFKFDQQQISPCNTFA